MYSVSIHKRYVVTAPVPIPAPPAVATVIEGEVEIKGGT